MIDLTAQAGEEGVDRAPVAGVGRGRPDIAMDTASRRGQPAGIPPDDDHLRPTCRHRPGDRLPDP